jgi:hypothetical protein|nr:MAG TPA: CII protein [Caudoviricetes sp.]DAH53811.1 MAG TPA: CII protein [Caudoviricetes sp.]DAV66284.1 MAG TPA: CII protein [Bacteriophage sp.]
MRLYELQKAKEILQIAKGTVLMAEYKMQFRDGFLDRTKQMSGLKTDEAFAGAIGVSESVLARAKKTNECTPLMLIGLYKAFGFQPGEIAQIKQTA